MDPSVCSLCHPWFSTTNLSYRFPIVQLPPWCFEKKRNAHRLIAEPCHFWFPGVLGFGIILGFRIIFFGFRIIFGCRIIGFGFRIIRFWLQNHPWFQNHSSSFRCSWKANALKVMPFLSIFTSRAAMPRTQTPCIWVSANFTMFSWQLSKDSSSTALFPIKTQHGFLSRPASFSANESRKSSAALRFASLVTIVSACEDMRKWNADESEFILLPNFALWSCECHKDRQRSWALAQMEYKWVKVYWKCVLAESLQTRRYKSWCKPGKRINLTVCIHGSAGSCWIRDGHDSSILLQMLSKWVNPGKDRKYMEIWFGSRISIDLHSIPLCLWKALWINHFWWLCWLSCWRLGLGGHGKGQLFLGRWQIEKYLHVSSCIYIPYNYIII